MGQITAVHLTWACFCSGFSNCCLGVTLFSALSRNLPSRKSLMALSQNCWNPSNKSPVSQNLAKMKANKGSDQRQLCYQFASQFRYFFYKLLMWFFGLFWSLEVFRIAEKNSKLKINFSV